MGVKVIMSMDNLDTMFHPPDYVAGIFFIHSTKAQAKFAMPMEQGFLFTPVDSKKII